MCKFDQLCEHVDGEFSGIVDSYAQIAEYIDAECAVIDMEYFSALVPMVIETLNLRFRCPWIKSYNRRDMVVVGHDDGGAFVLNTEQACHRLAKQTDDVAFVSFWPEVIGWAVDQLGFTGEQITYMLQKPHKHEDTAVHYCLENYHPAKWMELFE